MPKYIRDVGQVTNPAGLELSRRLLRRLQPELRGALGLLLAILGLRRKVEGPIAELLELSDARPAVVLSTAPLLIASYSDELDASIVLRFPDWLVGEHELSVGRRLLGVMVYYSGEEEDPRVAEDIVPGPRNTGNWINFGAYIAEFLSTDLARIEHCKRRIREEEWERCVTMADVYLEHSGGRSRNGLPADCDRPAGEGDE